MALLRKNYTEIPPDAVVLTEKEAVKYQTKILNTWKHGSDVFAYNYGRYFLGASSLVSALFITSHFRNKFRLLHYGRASTYLPVCVIPAVFSAVTHVEFVLTDVLLQKRDVCPVCLELRAAALQSLQGCIFPVVLAPVACLSLAHRYVTINLPDVAKEPMKLLQFVKSKARPISNVLFGIFLGQAVLGSVVTYFEAKSVSTVNTKLSLLEEELERMPL